MILCQDPDVDPAVRASDIAKASSKSDVFSVQARLISLRDMPKGPNPMCCFISKSQP